MALSVKLYRVVGKGKDRRYVPIDLGRRGRRSKEEVTGNWRQRYGCVNEHNGWVPRDFWMEPWEKEAIIEFHLKNPLEGYRRLTFMMLDADVVAVSPASVGRVLKQAGLLSQWKRRPSRKGTGFEQPLQPHQHWHIDVSYINLRGAFYYLCSILDGSVVSSCIGTCVSPCGKRMSK
jgi:hypothetical protein